MSLADEILALFGDLPAPDAPAIRAKLEHILEEVRGQEGDRSPAVLTSFFQHLATLVRGASGSAAETLAAMRPKDLWLAWRCAAADPEAIKTFHAAYDGDIHRAMRGVRVVGMGLDDLAQELAGRMFVGPNPKIMDYSGRGDLRAWVRIVATRAALDHARVKKNNADVPTEEDRLGRLAGGSNDTPDQAYFRRLYRVEVARAIEQAALELDVEDRNALREHYVRGLTVDQIAATHGIHRATAARRVQRARETLMASVKRILDERHGLTGRDLASVMGLVRSQIHLTMDRVLA